jgi:Flp pilus assembly protein TadD
MSFPLRCLFILLAGISLAPAQTVEGILIESDTLTARGEHRESLEILLEADRLRPNHAETLHRIARQYDQLSVIAATKAEQKSLNLQALDAAQRAVKADPKNASAHLALSIVYGRNANHEAARRKVELSRLIKEEAETAARLDPRQDVAWHILGRWNYELANFNPVLKALAQTIYGKFPDASNAKAVEHFQKAVALQPRNVLHQIELGRAYLAVGEKEKARQHLRIGLELPATTPDNREAQQRGRDTLKQLP